MTEFGQDAEDSHGCSANLYTQSGINTNSDVVLFPAIDIFRAVTGLTLDFCVTERI